MGENVKGWKIGDYAGIKWLNGSCMACEYCELGNESNCPHADLSGYTHDGSFQEYATADAVQAAHIPQGTDLAEVAPVLCAGITVYKALKSANLMAGHWVAISGAAGGLGSLAVQYAKAMGYRVLGIDGGEGKEELFRSIGGEVFIDFTKEKDIVGAVLKAGVKECTTMSFSELLKQCRKQKGISQAELASKLGVTQQAVGKWESGRSSPDPATVARIAEILSTTADFLLGLYRPVSNVTTPEERFFGNYAESLIPVIGTVKAGYGALAFEEDYGQEYARVKDPSNYFYLVVRGDSMEPRIQDGDLALVHKQDTLENGDLGVLVYGDEGEGTLKRYIQRGNCVVLQPFNPAYNELVIKGEDLNHLHIAGRVVETKAKW